MVVRRGGQRYGFTAHTTKEIHRGPSSYPPTWPDKGTAEQARPMMMMLLLFSSSWMDGYSVAELMRVINTRPI